MAWLLPSTPAFAAEPVGEPEGEEAQRPTSDGYFSAQPDMRACPAPDCGGFFVGLLNRVQTRCADGVDRPLCHANTVDFTHLDLDPDARTELDQELSLGRALLRGRLVPGRRVPGFGPLGRLIATEAWIAASARQPRGRYYRVSDLGIVCVAAPCFSLRESLLNTAQLRDLSGLDLRPTGAGDAAITDALAGLHREPILVAGRNRVEPDLGPAGDGLALVALQFYRRLLPR